MRLRGEKITIIELESIYGLEILSPNHFRINNLLEIFPAKWKVCFAKAS